MKTAHVLAIVFILLLIPLCAYCQLWKQYIDSGKIYKEQQKLDKAIEFYSKAREELKRDSMGTGSYAAICHNLANLYLDKVQYDKAEPLLLEAKQIRERVLGKLHVDYANSCNSLAILYYRMGQYEKAELLFVEAKQIREKVVGKLHVDYANSCHNLANFYYRMGQYQKAAHLCEEAKQIREEVLGKLDPDYARSCNNLGTLYKKMGQYDKAEPLLLEAKQIRERVLGKLHIDYANSCHALASLYIDMAKYQKAEPLLLEAKQIQEKVVGKLHTEYATSCYNLAILYNDIGQYQQAESLFLEAKQIQEKILGKFHPDYYQSCTDLANLYRNMKEPEKAKGLYAEAYTSQQIQVKNMFRFTSEAEQQSYLKLTGDLQDYFFSFTFLYPQYNHGLNNDMVISNRNLILSSSQQLRNVMYASADSSSKRKYDEWIDARGQLAFWYSKPITERPDYVKNLEELANTLEKELMRKSFTFQKQQAQNSVTCTWRNIQQTLKADEAAIEFASFRYYNGKHWTDSTYYVALLLTKNQPEPQLIPLFESRQLNNLLRVSNTFLSINVLYSKREGESTAYDLSWKPIEPYLKNTKKIYFAPAGLLFRVSFAALPINDHQVLSDKYDLVQLNTTAAVVNKSDDVISTADNVYLYGAIKYNVDSATLKQAVLAYNSTSKTTHSIADDPGTRFITDDSTRGSSLNYLPGTQKEIEAISSLGKRKGYAVAVISGDSATEESVKTLNGKLSPAVLHMATHGFFFQDPKEKRDSIPASGSAQSPFRCSDNPLMRSGLCFAGANNTWQGKLIEGVEDGILTSYEVSNLYLPNTRLVVLSACKTALGEIQGNESVYGLQRAFKIAGVENLVMSLWIVPDRETAEFMQEFYKNMFEKQSINEAFYNAQTTMKNKYRKEPFKWAAWILVR
jgi:CHAT domain-containing protein